MKLAELAETWPQSHRAQNGEMAAMIRVGN